MKNCCYKCEKRSVGCHSTCEAYKSYRAEIDSRKVIAARERTVEEYFAESAKRSHAGERKEQ